MSSCTVPPMDSSSTTTLKSAALLTGRPLTPTITSPGTMPPSERRMGCRPALAAALPASTLCTTAPFFTRSACATRSGATSILSDACLTSPTSISCGTTRRTVSMGIAKPTPAEVPELVKMAVLTPMTAPEESRSGPPLLPGLMAASVWMPPPMTVPSWLRMSRPRPLMAPVVRVWSKPKGLPIARHSCPTRRLLEAPSCTGRSASGGALTFTTARSRRRSAPTSTPS
mmetsp:Transcript_45013/g.113957  ORF Transcript_45013/g.113957 Transcript_45013/m.113957 type:complete len:228 (+) Transcript_45013:182-865(+)